MTSSLNNQILNTLADGNGPERGPNPLGKFVSVPPPSSQDDWSASSTSPFVPFWLDAEVAAADPDNPENAADASGVWWTAPQSHRGFLHVMLERSYYGTEGTVTYPVIYVFGRVGSKSSPDSRWVALPDSNGDYGTTVNNDKVIGVSNEKTTKRTAEVEFDLLGCQDVMILVGTALSETGSTGAEPPASGSGSGSGTGSGSGSGTASGSGSGSGVTFSYESAKLYGRFITTS